MAWQNLDWQFRLHISKPILTIIIYQFYNQLDRQINTWFEMADLLEKTNTGQQGYFKQ